MKLISWLGWWLFGVSGVELEIKIERKGRCESVTRGYRCENDGGLSRWRSDGWKTA